MNNNKDRMSPLTAMFIGLWVIGAFGITGLTGVVLYGMRMVDRQVTSVVGLVEGTVEDLPKLIESLPPSISKLLNDRRAPEYAAQLEVVVSFAPDARSGGLLPVLKVINHGDRVVSLLGVRVAALGANDTPLEEWGDIVATPIALDDDDWPGPILPGSTRYTKLSHWRGLPAALGADVRGVFEISELRVWNGPGDGADLDG